VIAKSRRQRRLFVLAPRFTNTAVVLAKARTHYHSSQLLRELVQRHCEERSDEAIQTISAEVVWIASLRSQ
jgi:hypothetical protein